MSVGVDIGIRSGIRPRIRQGIGNQWAQEPTTLARLNAIFAPWGASFSHAWRFQESSGNALDLASSGAIPLVPGASAPTRAVSTGLIAGDRGCQFTDLSSQRLAPASTSDLDITTGDLVMLATIRFPTTPAGSRIVLGKTGAGARYRIVLLNTGNPRFESYDGTTTLNSEIAVDHVGTAYHDLLAVVSRSGGTDEQVFASNLGSSAVGTPGANSLTNTTAFLVGDSASSCAPQIVSFLAWGTVPGTLIANRTAALAAWRRARGA